LSGADKTIEVSATKSTKRKLNEQDEDGQTPLQIAETLSRTDIIALLQ